MAIPNIKAVVYCFIFIFLNRVETLVKRGFVYFKL